MKQLNASSTCTTGAWSHPIVSDPFTVALIRAKARQLCRRTDFSRSDYDELRQGMRLYLLEKAHLFDPERGNLQAFVTQMIKTWVAMQLRYRTCPKRGESFTADSLERTTVEHEGQMTSLGGTLLEEDGRRLTRSYPRSDTELFELRDALAHVMAKLDPEDRALLTSVAEIGLKPTARKLGVSWRQVTNALNRIRQECEKAGLDHT